MRAAVDAAEMCIRDRNGLRPILCVGESLTEREQDVTMEVIRKQIKIALQNVAVEDIKKVVIAYEPIWAIGTGKTATAEQANEVCSAIRDCLREKYGARAARGITIQYGGSMNAKNASELLAQPDVDGGLIGGASLKSADFEMCIRDRCRNDSEELLLLKTELHGKDRWYTLESPALAAALNTLYPYDTIGSTVTHTVGTN